MQSIQDEAPHALAVSAGAVAGLMLRPYSPVAVSDTIAGAVGVGLGCVGYQLSQGSGFADLVLYKQSVTAAAAAAVGTMYPVLGSAYLNAASFAFVGDQLGNYFLN